MAHEGGSIAGTPLLVFCTRLKRLQVASGLTQVALASRVGLGKSQMSEILNGTIKGLPDWDVIREVVRACIDHAGKKSMTLGADLGDENEWRRRYHDLEGDVEVVARARRRSQAMPGRTIGQWDPFGLGVHHPITPARSRRSRLANLPALPAYVARDHDRQLHDLIDPGQPGPRMVVLVGRSCTGKTRAAYEAVRSCLADWTLARPEGSTDLLRLLAERPLAEQTVLWLNETHTYLDGQQGEEAAAALRRLLAGRSRVLVIGSMWPVHWQTLTTRTAPTEPDHPQARELLEQAAVKVRVPDSFTGQMLADVERAAAEQAVNGDPRLAEAIDAAPRSGEFTQVLAGGPWLLDFYQHQADSHIVAILNAAVDAHLLGHHAPLPATLLEQGAAGYLNDQDRAASAGWFDQALSHATEKIQGAVAPLTGVRVRRGVGEPDGYLIADYLLQHASAERAPYVPPGDIWDALASHTVTAADHVRIAAHADDRSYLRHAVYHARQAVQGGANDAEELLAGLLMGANPSAEAIRMWQHLDAWSHLVHALERAGRVDEAVALCQLRDPYADGALEEALQHATRANDPRLSDSTVATSELAGVLERAGRLDEALVVMRQVYMSDDDEQFHLFDQLEPLLRQVGDVDEAVRAWEPWARAGQAPAMRDQAHKLERAGRVEDAIAAWKRLAEHDGDSDGIIGISRVLRAAGRDDEAAALIDAEIASRRPAAERDETGASRNLACLLEQAGQPDEAEQWLCRAAEQGDTHALVALVRLLWAVERMHDAMQVWQRLLASDKHRAWLELAKLVDVTWPVDTPEPRTRQRNHRPAREVIDACRQQARHGNTTAMCLMAKVLEAGGHDAEAEDWLRRAAEHGHTRHLEWGLKERSTAELARYLRRAGRRDEAELVLRFGIEPGGQTAAPWA